MSEKWKILDTGIQSVKNNMEIDARLLADLKPNSSIPILHLYDWEAPSATYGHFIDPTNYLSEQGMNSPYLQIAKRSTGGGLIFHTTDWAFSILVPAGHKAYSVNVLENYFFVNQMVVEIIKNFIGESNELTLLPKEPEMIDRDSKQFCMAKPTKYDVMLNGLKVAGGAQRRTKSGFLHQGTISLTMPDEGFLEKVLLPNVYELVQENMHKNTCALLELTQSLKEIKEARHYLSESFQKLVRQ